MQTLHNKYSLNYFTNSLYVTQNISIDKNTIIFVFIKTLNIKFTIFNVKISRFTSAEAVKLILMQRRIRISVFENF